MGAGATNLVLDASCADDGAGGGNGERRMLTILLILVLVLALGGGGWGYSRYGYVGMTPAGLILLVLIVLWLTGNLHF